MESVTPEKFLSQIFRSIRQEGDAKEVFLARKLDGVIKQHRAITVALIPFVNHEVFQQNHKSTFRRTDGEKEIDHPDDHAVTSENEHAPPARLLKNQSQTAELFFFVGPEITFLGEKFAKHFGQFIQISLGCRLNNNFLAHRQCALPCLIAEIVRTGNPRFEDARGTSRTDRQTPCASLTILRSILR